MARLRPRLALDPLGDVPEEYAALSPDSLERRALEGDLHAITALAMRAEIDNRLLDAHRWWSIGAEQEDGTALHNLAIHAYEVEDYAAATYYWREAAMSGCRQAQYNVGVIQQDAKGND